METAEKARWDLANTLKKMERKAGKLLMMTIAPLLLNFVGMAMGQNLTLITAITKIGLQLGWQNGGGCLAILPRTSTAEHTVGLTNTYSSHYLQRLCSPGSGSGSSGKFKKNQ
jgi:hypothetical protein